MSRSGVLPEFVREAVLVDESAPRAAEPQGAAALPLESGAAALPLESGDAALPLESGAAAAERSLLALEDALSDVVEVETTHVRVPASLLARGPARLLQSALEPPLRHAPLFSRVARFLDLSEDAVMRELTRLREPARWSPTAVRGVWTLPLRRGPRLHSAAASLIRIDAGACLGPAPSHGLQRLLVLEGTCQGRSGAVCRPGDVSERRPGGDESVSAAPEQRCILVSLVFGSGLRGWFRRVLAAISAR